MLLGVYAVYMSLVYGSPMIGGILADKILGFLKVILLGGVLISLGHFLLTFEHSVFSTVLCL